MHQTAAKLAFACGKWHQSSSIFIEQSYPQFPEFGCFSIFFPRRKIFRQDKNPGFFAFKLSNTGQGPLPIPMNFLSTTFFPHIPLGFQTYLDVYIGADDKSLTDSLIGPVDKMDPAVEKKMESNETIIRTIISSYCRSRNFHRRIFSQIWLKQTFHEFLILSLSKEICNLHRVDH